MGSEMCIRDSAQTGYTGRVGITEIMPMTDPLRSLVMKHATAAELRVEAVRRRWHKRILTLPVMGVLSRSINTARFSSTLAILVGSGVPMLRSLQAAGLEVTAITDVTPIPHNGCRPPKRRRV